MQALVVIVYSAFLIAPHREVGGWAFQVETTVRGKGRRGWREVEGGKRRQNGEGDTGRHKKAQEEREGIPMVRIIGCHKYTQLTAPNTSSLAVLLVFVKSQPSLPPRNLVATSVSEKKLH
jgi:hypothetical protein